MSTSQRELQNNQLQPILYSSRGYGHPNPRRFTFSESRFPLNVRLPAKILAQKTGSGEIRNLTPDDILCYFDDVIMPFTIIDGVINIEVPRDPFEKLYRPKVYDKLSITVVVYLKQSRAQQLGLNPTTATTSASASGTAAAASMAAGQKALQTTAVQEAAPAALKVTEKANASVDTKDSLENKRINEGILAPGIIIYKSTFRFRMSSDIGSDSDSESDEEEQSIPKGVVAKQRYNVAEHLKLNMTIKGQEALFALLQAYLRGSFFLGPQSNLAQEKSRRNVQFIEAMKQDVDAARGFASMMLLEIGQYYLKHCRSEPDFRHGILQLLDFSYSLGKLGFKLFDMILKDCPLFANKKIPLRFCFVRKFGNDFRNVFVTRSISGRIDETIEIIDTKENQRAPKDLVGNDLLANFDVHPFDRFSRQLETPPAKNDDHPCRKPGYTR